MLPSRSGAELEARGKEGHLEQADRLLARGQGVDHKAGQEAVRRKRRQETEHLNEAAAHSGSSLHHPWHSYRLRFRIV